MRKSIFATALVALMALPAISLADGRFGSRGGHDYGRSRSSFNLSIGIGGGYRGGYASSYYRGGYGYRGYENCGPSYYRSSYCEPRYYYAPPPPVVYYQPAPPVYYTPGPVYYNDGPCYDSGDYVRFSYGYRR